jgi:hypothetical protein
MGLHIWALSHALPPWAGDAARRALDVGRGLLEAGVLIYLEGLGLRGGPAPIPRIK